MIGFIIGCGIIVFVGGYIFPILLQMFFASLPLFGFVMFVFLVVAIYQSIFKKKQVYKNNEDPFSQLREELKIDEKFEEKKQEEKEGFVIRKVRNNIMLFDEEEFREVKVTKPMILEKEEDEEKEDEVTLSESFEVKQSSLIVPRKKKNRMAKKRRG